ncbi:MAG: Carbamate kinase 1 [Candidatus Anoxychlamydiales bacterium]|nr:Carbamate kinase 1 [Candidatus Anoxychlamydiales bacterium]
MSEKVVIALGGNALLRAGEKGTLEEQLKHVDETAIHFLNMIKEGYSIAVTHGNGPQVGNILLQNEYSKDKIPSMPLDVCGAMSQGFIGYMLQRLTFNEIQKGSHDIKVVTLLTQVLVDKNDNAFKNPSKPVGPYYTKEQSEKLAKENNWTMMEQIGKGYRRCVPSPEPIGIVEEFSIKKLFEDNVIVIACGGGGIPVIKHENNMLEGVEAVIDKDRTACVLAKTIKADVLMILTDVEKAYINFHKPNQEALHNITITEAKKYLAEDQFGKGSMGPKVEAAIRFVEMGGKKSIITSLEKALEALNGKTGTIITKD